MSIVLRELPTEIWETIFSYIGSSVKYDLCCRASIFLLPLVNKMFERICKTNPLLKLRTRTYPYLTEIVCDFCLIGELSIVQFAHENGFASSNRILTAAAKGGYALFKYGMSQSRSSVSKDVLRSIFLTSGAEPKCLEYIHKTLEIELTANDAESALKDYQFDAFDYMWDQGIRPSWTSIPGNLIVNPKYASIVEHLHTKNMRADLNQLKLYYDYPDYSGAYEYTYKHGLEWPDNVTCLASNRNQLESLRYAHEHGAQWHIDTCQTASQKGAFECLSYAHEHGAKWNRHACLVLTVVALKEAIESMDASDIGFSLGYLPPTYDEAGLVKCIRYLLVHQDLVYDPSTLVLPSLEEQNKICKDYLDQQSTEKLVNFSIVYDRLDPRY